MKGGRERESGRVTLTSGDLDICIDNVLRF